MIKLNASTVGTSAVFIYIELTISALAGYVLWILLSRITTPDAIGVASTTISLATMFTAISSLGLPNSITRHVGKSISEDRIEDAQLALKSALLLTSIGIFSCSIAISIFEDYWILRELDTNFIILCVIFMGSSTIATLFRHTIISCFKSKTLVSLQISTSAVKVLLSVILILIGFGGLGLVIGYAASQIVAVILMTFVIVEIFRGSKGKPGITLRQSCQSLFAGGIPSWVPASITAIGAQLGTVVVFGASGANQAGTYFIAFSIFSAVVLIGNSLISSAFPVLSSLVDGRKRLLWRITKISLIISLPISFSFIFYSEEILSLLGPDYVQSSTSLQILLLSIFPVIVSMAITILVYAYGNYRQALAIGLATSIPRAVLYFVAVPLYDGNEAAISYTVGSVAGFVISVLIARKVGFTIFWRDLCLMLTVPATMAFVLSYIQITYILSLIIMVVSMCIMYTGCGF